MNPMSASGWEVPSVEVPVTEACNNRYGGEPDLRFIDAVVAQLRRVEAQLPPD